MKILSGIDIPFNPFGGSPIICDDWYSNYPKQHEVLFLTMPSTDKKWWTMPSVHFLKTNKIKDPRHYPSYIKELNQEVGKIIANFQPDLIHLQHLNFGLSRSFIEIAPHVPKIGICHGTDTQAAKQSDFFKDNLIRIADSTNDLVFPTELMAKDFFSVYGKEKAYKVISHGLPRKLFVRHQTHLPENKLKFLYAGRLNQYKGADIAITAISHLGFPVQLDVIGDEDESGYKSKLKSIVSELKLQEQVTFYKKVTRENIWGKFSEYDCILIPSRALEAFSLTAVEAQARGLTVVYGNGGGIKNVVGDSGICIEDNKSKTLTKIIKKINSDRSILLEYRKRGYKNAQKYKLENQIFELNSLSEKLVNKKENTL